MARHLKWLVLFSLLTAFWLGVISEAVATCVWTSVCSYPRTLPADILLIAFFMSMAGAAYNAFMAAKG